MKKIIIAAVILIAGGGAVWFAYSKKPATEYLTAKAERKTLTQTVAETGTLKSPKEISLNFLASGKIARLLAKVGDRVSSGQTLAELDNSKLILKQSEARAALTVAEANLGKVLAGASNHDIEIARAGAAQAETAYQNARAQLERTRKTADENTAQAQKTLDELKSPANRAANNKRDPVLTAMEEKNNVAVAALDLVKKILDDENADDVLSVKDVSILVNAENSYDQANLLVGPAQSALAAAKISRTDADIETAVTASLSLLDTSLKTLNFMYSALAKTITSSKFSQTQLDTYKSDVASKLTAVSTGISAVQTAYQALKDAIASAENSFKSVKLTGESQLAAGTTSVDAAYQAWLVARAQLAKIEAPTRAEDVRLARAQVEQAAAALRSVDKQIEDGFIRAPIDGVATKVNYEVGEEPQVGKPVVALVSRNAYEIDIDVAETDIVKVAQGQRSLITFDAFGEEKQFAGMVTFIEPAQTVIQDVIYYKTTVSDIKPASGTDPALAAALRPGMTANVSITTAKKDNALVVPARAVIEKGAGQKIVRVLENSQAVEKAVTIGLRGDEGMVEVLSGLNENEQVVTSIKNNGTR